MRFVAVAVAVAVVAGSRGDHVGVLAEDGVRPVPRDLAARPARRRR